MNFVNNPFIIVILGFSLFSSIKYFDFNSRQPKIRLLDDAPQRHFKFSSSFCHLQKSSFIEFWSSWFLETDNYKLNWVRSRNVFQFQSENLILAGKNPLYHNFQVKLAINLGFLEKHIFDAMTAVLTTAYSKELNLIQWNRAKCTVMCRVSAKRTLRLERTRFLTILNDSYVYYKG